MAIIVGKELLVGVCAVSLIVIQLVVVVQALFNTRIPDRNNLCVSIARPVGPQKDTSCSQYATDIPQDIQRSGKHLEWLAVGVLQRWQYVEKDIEQVHGQ